MRKINGIRVAAFLLNLVGSLLFINTDAFAYAITTATLAGPTCITCPPDGNIGKYTISLTGTGQSDTIASWLNFAVYDDDPGLDDLLQDETVFNILGDGTGTGNWTKVLNFDLWCADGCEVRGKDGKSWETTAEVYALIEDSWGFNLKYTNTLNVSCCPVPEPTSMALLCVGFLVFAAFRSGSHVEDQRF